MNKNINYRHDNVDGSIAMLEWYIANMKGYVFLNIQELRVYDMLRLEFDRNERHREDKKRREYSYSVINVQGPHENNEKQGGETKKSRSRKEVRIEYRRETNELHVREDRGGRNEKEMGS